MGYGMIIVNRIITPDGTVLTSKNRHDYRCHEDANGFTYCVDGGIDYLRRTYSDEAPKATEASVYSEDPHELIRETFTWGTYGKTGKDPLRHVALKDLEKEHIKAIIKTQSHITQEIKDVFVNELCYRNSNA
tara:strand:+ start:145 stop:540 length:396 start_codon:yes stop_codon:yes gene_type:complete